MTDNKYMVCTRCSTYNHEKYIEDALNGFCIQQTTFPVVYCILDDCSTDNTPVLIYNYLQNNFDLEDKTVVRHEETTDFCLTFAKHKSNKNCYFAVFLLKYNHFQIKKNKLLYFEEWSRSSSYHAACEGDDFWIDPLKLSKQVAFMQSHPNCSLCITAYYEINPFDEKVVKCLPDTPYYIYTKDYMLGNERGLFFSTASMLYIPEHKERPKWMKGLPIGDVPLFLLLAEYGDVVCLADITTCYRCFNPGSWSVRKSTDIKYRLNLYKSMAKMWRGYDEWTGKKYHSLVKGHIRINEKRYRHEKFIDILNSISPKIVDFIKRNRKSPQRPYCNENTNSKL